MSKKASDRMELSDLSPHNLRQLKLLNSVLFPVPYTEKFYNDCVASGDLCKLVYFEDIVVGAVCCRIESDPATPGVKQLYIMTLGCLAAYRRLGVGTLMLNHVLSLAKADSSIASIYLHVQISNTDAVEFYKKHGFTIKETIPDYYKKTSPTEAYVLSRPAVLPA
eukprot:m.55441 g.55441  ORF g.55441 m.55441 type:complete len:165 (+) comp13313_c0_seq1:117-611(+)